MPVFGRTVVETGGSTLDGVEQGGWEPLGGGDLVAREVLGLVEESSDVSSAGGRGARGGGGRGASRTLRMDRD